MKIAVFPKTSAIAGKPVMSAFIESLKGEDYVICQNHERPDADIVVMWSWLLGMYGRDAIYNHYKKTNAKFVILEVGALQRNTSWKVAIGGINRDADFGNQHVDDSRLSLFDLTPSDWHAAGDHIIICGQNERSIAWNQGATAQWVNKMIGWISSQTDRPIWFRPHPRFPVHFKDADDKKIFVSQPKKLNHQGNIDEVDFAQAVSQAHAVVNYNSNPAIESVLAGVPVYVDQSSLCWPVGNAIGSDIDNPVKPDRAEWCKQISYTEWFVEEIKQGLPWKRLRQNLIAG
tara:strand:+ start:1065 stop:1928 length:864 start_codon:yes stop_codon:yes gene_type:complete